jgi:hypothetical protein
LEAVNSATVLFGILLDSSNRQPKTILKTLNFIIMKNIFKISAFVFALGLMSFTVLPIKKSEGKSIAISPVAWKSETIDIGEIPQGTPKHIVFEFKNTGDKAILITSAKPSCGCTLADYTKTPIQPGETATVTATYNAAAKGPFTKNVTVTTNAEEVPKVLHFKGIVTEVKG